MGRIGLARRPKFREGNAFPFSRLKAIKVKRLEERTDNTVFQSNTGIMILSRTPESKYSEVSSVF